jgi:hypothetical protein
MTVKAAVEPVNGRFSYEPYNRSADAIKAPVLVLLEDELQGYGLNVAYVSGTRGMLYFPQVGDMLQMLVANVSGTGEAFPIGTELMIDDGTGLLIALTGTPEMKSFQSMETMAGGITADTYLLCMYTGH